MPRDRQQDRLNYVVSELFNGLDSDVGAFSKLTPRHDNMVNHHIAIVSSGALAAGEYSVRITAYAGGSDLPVTADTGKSLVITGKNSAQAFFTGIIRGISLAVTTPLSAGETISCVLTSSSAQLDNSGVVI